MQKNFSLFDDFPVEETISTPSKKISVTFAEYSDTLQVEPDELFRGFNELHAVTFSAGVRQIERVMKFFERGAVIIGSHEQISTDLAEMLALQKFAVDFVSKNTFLKQMIAAGNFKFYVTDKVHAKIYLLHADDGRCRVILTSANFSANAWQNHQREIFVVMDNSMAYEYYLNVFEELRKNSADEIDLAARPLKDDGTNLELLPAIKSVVYTKSAVVVHELPPESAEDAEYLFAQRETAQKFRDLFKEADIHADSRGKTLIVAEKISRIKKDMRRVHEEAVARKKSKSTLAPEMILDYDNRRVTFNDELWDLNPPAAEIQADLENLVAYINGTEIFTRDVANLKSLYWKIILYMFASPFFARLRYFYSRLVPANSTGKVFPMYMILRGPKNGGKSSVVMTAQRLMFNRDISMIPAKEIAPSNFENYKMTIKGCPILIDDATNRNLQYLKDIVKDDYALIKGKILDHGTFIFTSNDAEQIRQEISKRVIVFSVPNQLNEDDSTRRDSVLKKIQNSMHNALYRAYLAKMFPKVADLTEEIICGGKPDWLPDIFRISSETLTEIFREHELETPSELKIFRWEDYLGEKIKSNQAIGKIEYLFVNMPEIFRVDERRDQLAIDLSKILDQKARLKVADLLESELPPSTERNIIGNIVTMRLSEIKKFARVSFTDDKNFLQRLLAVFNRR